MFRSLALAYVTIACLIATAISAPQTSSSATSSLLKRQDPNSPQQSTGKFPAGTCPRFLFMTVRGCCDSRYNSFYMNQIVDPLMSRVSGGYHVEADWNSATSLTIPVNSAEGTDWYVNYARNFVKACPGVPIITHSYSLGTTVTVPAYNDPTFPVDSVVSNTYWGSFYWHPFQPFNAGTAKLGLAWYGAMAIQTPPSLFGKTKDFCNVGDPVCTGAAYNDADIAVHHGYINQPYLDQAIDFHVSKLSAAGVN